MPFDKDGIKWACPFCVNGHRSTDCKHWDRAMIRVRRPGRPLTVCPHPQNGRGCPCDRGGIIMVKVEKEGNCICEPAPLEQQDSHVGSDPKSHGCCSPPIRSPRQTKRASRKSGSPKPTWHQQSVDADMIARGRMVRLENSLPAGTMPYVQNNSMLTSYLTGHDDASGLPLPSSASSIYLQGYPVYPTAQGLPFSSEVGRSSNFALLDHKLAEHPTRHVEQRVNNQTMWDAQIPQSSLGSSSPTNKWSTLSIHGINMRNQENPELFQDPQVFTGVTGNFSPQTLDPPPFAAQGLVSCCGDLGNLQHSQIDLLSSHAKPTLASLDPHPPLSPIALNALQYSSSALSPAITSPFVQHIPGFSPHEPIDTALPLNQQPETSANEPKTNCTCGTGCNCFMCVDHPNNEKTREVFENVLEDERVAVEREKIQGAPEPDYSISRKIRDTSVLTSGGSRMDVLNSDFDPQKRVTPVASEFDFEGMPVSAHLPLSRPDQSPDSFPSSGNYETFMFRQDPITGSFINIPISGVDFCQCGPGCKCVNCFTHHYNLF